MQILKRIAPLVLLSALAFSFSSTASAIMSLSNGFYGEGNIGYGSVDTRGVGRRDDGVAGSVIIGYKGGEYWAVDTGYTKMPRANVSTHIAHLAVKGIYALGDGSWDVFGKVGGAYARGQRELAVDPDGKGVFYYGAGVTYWFQQNFGAILQGSGTTKSGNVPAMYTGTVGLTLFF